MCALLRVCKVGLENPKVGQFMKFRETVVQVGDHDDPYLAARGTRNGGGSPTPATRQLRMPW